MDFGVSIEKVPAIAGSTKNAIKKSVANIFAVIAGKERRGMHGTHAMLRGECVVLLRQAFSAILGAGGVRIRHSDYVMRL